MPTYQYECSACAHALEVRQSFADEPLVNCPECGKKKLGRIITGGIPISGCKINHQDVKTLQHYAERNAEKMSKGELEDKRYEHSLRRPENRPGRKPQPKYKKPWWRTTDKIDTSLAKLTPSQKQKYIETGDKP